MGISRRDILGLDGNLDDLPSLTVDELSRLGERIFDYYENGVLDWLPENMRTQYEDLAERLNEEWLRRDSTGSPTLN